MKDTIALTRNKQSRFAKKFKNVKEKVKKGILSVNENIKPKKPKPQRGVIYIGHLPHGFYETEMNKYFRQFGKVTNVRVCRSKKNGNSRGFGFVEFMYPEVAEVAAETMNNYLMFNRRLISKYIPPEKQKENMFNKKPWTLYDYPLKFTREQYRKKKNKDVGNQKYQIRVEKQIKNLRKKVNQLNTLGIEYNFKPVDVPEDKIALLNKSGTDELEHTYVQDPYDSDIEVRVTRSKKKAMNLEKENIIIKPLKGITKTKNKISGKRNKQMKVMKNNKLLKLAVKELASSAITNTVKKGKRLIVKSEKTGS